MRRASVGEELDDREVGHDGDRVAGSRLLLDVGDDLVEHLRLAGQHLDAAARKLEPRRVDVAEPPDQLARVGQARHSWHHEQRRADRGASPPAGQERVRIHDGEGDERPVEHGEVQIVLRLVERDQRDQAQAGQRPRAAGHRARSSRPSAPRRRRTCP